MYFKYANENVEFCLKHELTYEDLVIIKYISIAIQFSTKLDTYVDEKGVYVWLKTDKMLKELSMLYASNITLLRKINSLCSKGIVEKVVKCEEKTSFKKSYYRISNDTVKNLNFEIKEKEIPNVGSNVILTQPNAIDKEYINNNYIYNNIIGFQPKIPFEIEEIFNYWNSKNIVKHQKLTVKIQEVISKTLKKHKLEEIETYIDRYSRVLKDEKYFFDYKWTLVQFLTQKNCMLDFTDEGSKWVNYINANQNSKENNNTPRYKTTRGLNL